MLLYIYIIIIIFRTLLAGKRLFKYSLAYGKH